MGTLIPILIGVGAAAVVLGFFGLLGYMTYCKKKSDDKNEGGQQAGEAPGQSTNGFDLNATGKFLADTGNQVSGAVKKAVTIKQEGERFI